MSEYLRKCLNSLREDLVLRPYALSANSKTNRTVIKVYPNEDRVFIGGPTPGSRPATNTTIKGLAIRYDWDGKPTRPARAVVATRPGAYVSQTMLWNEVRALSQRLVAVEEAVARPLET